MSDAMILRIIIAAGGRPGPGSDVILEHMAWSPGQEKGREKELRILFLLRRAAICSAHLWRVGTTDAGGRG